MGVYSLPLLGLFPRGVDEPARDLATKALQQLVDGIGDLEGAVSLLNGVIAGDAKYGWMKQLFLHLVVLLGI
jgi:hypothetical protein